MGTGPPTLTGVPFNDAYRYMDWLLTLPLLLMEIVLVMNLPKEESNSKCWVLGVGSALMIVSGYSGELVITGDLAPPLAQLVPLDVLLPLRGVHAPHWLERGYQLRVRPRREGHAPERPIDHGHQLVHVPDRVPLPDAPHWRGGRRDRDPDRLLRLGHHLKVRCRLDDLPDHHAEVQQREVCQAFGLNGGVDVYAKGFAL